MPKMIKGIKQLAERELTGRSTAAGWNGCLAGGKAKDRKKSVRACKLQAGERERERDGVL
jgi:hypothetical protein